MSQPCHQPDTYVGVILIAAAPALSSSAALADHGPAQQSCGVVGVNSTCPFCFKSPTRVCCRLQLNIEAVYHQLAMLRSKLAATAAARTGVPPSEAAASTQTENALLTLVEANVRVVECQR